MTKLEKAWANICAKIACVPEFPTNDLYSVADALHKFQKYSWHDLRKDPEDLPSENGKYFVVNSDREFDILYYCKNARCFGYECCWTHDELPECPNEYYFEPIDEEESPIAWKEEAIEF